jgi:hypothetical protein
MFSRWVIKNITFARGTLHFRKIRIPCDDQLVICGLYETTVPLYDRFDQLLTGR